MEGLLVVGRREIEQDFSAGRVHVGAQQQVEHAPVTGKAVLGDVLEVLHVTQAGRGGYGRDLVLDREAVVVPIGSQFVVLVHEVQCTADGIAVDCRVAHDAEIRQFRTREHAQRDIRNVPQDILHDPVDLPLSDVTTLMYVPEADAGASQCRLEQALLFGLSQHFGHAREEIGRDLALLGPAGLDVQGDVIHRGSPDVGKRCNVTAAARAATRSIRWQ